MATTIKVTPQELQTTASRIKGLAEEYKSEYEGLFQDVDAMRGKWDGQDNLAYTNQVGGFKDDFVNMYNLMVQYADYLMKTKKAYEETQTNIKTDASKLTN